MLLVWRGFPLTISRPAFIVICVSLQHLKEWCITLFVSLFYFMIQVRFLPKSLPSAALTTDRQTPLFTDTLAAKAAVKRGWSTEKKVDIPGGATLENLIMFSGTQYRTRWWRQGDKEKHLPHFPSPGEGPILQPGKLWLATNVLITETHTFYDNTNIKHVIVFCFLWKN